MALYYNDYWKNKETFDDTEKKWPVVSWVIPAKWSCRLLDFGCGKGTILRRVVIQNASVNPHGIDISNDAFKRHIFGIIELGYYARFYPVSHGMYLVCKKLNR